MSSARDADGRDRRVPDGRRTMTERLRCRLSGDPASAVAARHALADWLDAESATGCRDDASLVLEELVSNAIRHVGGDFVLRARLGSGVLRIEVEDGSPVRPVPRQADEAATSGRGLAIVAALSRAWGVEPRPSAKAVWAELPCERVTPGADRPAERVC